MNLLENIDDVYFYENHKLYQNQTHIRTVALGKPASHGTNDRHITSLLQVYFYRHFITPSLSVLTTLLFSAYQHDVESDVIMMKLDCSEQH